MKIEQNQLGEKIRELAAFSGIDVLGFAAAHEFSNYALRSSPRRDPKLSLPDAKTIIVAGVYIGGLTLPAWKNPWHGRSSRLYLSEFFLDVVKPLESVVKLLTSQGYRAIICDGSSEEGSILPLKLAAVRAGLGWQGKHSLLITKKFGTFLALGGIITNAGLEHNTKKEPNHCEKCDRCQQACPMGALNKPYVLDKNRCLSHLLQIENLPEKAQYLVENRIGDCEICQEACPWNKQHLKSPLMTHMTESFKEKIENWEEFFYLPNLVDLSEKQYFEVLGHLKTCIPYKLFHRNVSIATDHAKKMEKTKTH